MALIGIPRPVFPGIKIISELDQSQINKLIEYISKLPLEIEYKLVAEELNTLLNIEQGNNLLQTIISFQDLFEDNDDKNQIVAQNLSNSYDELSKSGLDEIRKQQLEHNVFLILSNFQPVKEIIKTREIYSANENNLSELNIITDLRVVFKDDIDDKNRASFILHKLHLEYTKNNELKEIYLTLDVKDLNKLKIQIEKAIQKDQILRDDYKDVLNFIF